LSTVLKKINLKKQNVFSKNKKSKKKSKQKKKKMGRNSLFSLFFFGFRKDSLSFFFGFSFFPSFRSSSKNNKQNNKTRKNSKTKILKKNSDLGFRQRTKKEQTTLFLSLSPEMSVVKNNR
jgi:hypothetical protein